MYKQVAVTITQSAKDVVVTNGSETWRFDYYRVDRTSIAAIATIAQTMLTSTIVHYLSQNDEVKLNLTIETEQL